MGVNFEVYLYIGADVTKELKAMLPEFGDDDDIDPEYELCKLADRLNKEYKLKTDMFRFHSHNVDYTPTVIVLGAYVTTIDVKNMDDIKIEERKLVDYFPIIKKHTWDGSWPKCLKKSVYQNVCLFGLCKVG